MLNEQLMMNENEEIETNEVLEQKHFQHVVDTFLYYRSSAENRMKQQQISFDCIPKEHQEMLPTFKNRFQKMLSAIDINYKFLKNIISHVDNMFVNSRIKSGRGENVDPITRDDMDRVYTTIRQCVRDWSKEGEVERKQCYEPIVTEICRIFPSSDFDRSKINILVPGAGLGRLMFDIASKGFSCHGNEFSMYMLFASNFFLNFCDSIESVSLFPWIHQSCNVMSINDRFREVKLPDVNTQSLDMNRISMGAGDFLETYTEQNHWDCVAMSFFLDTAHNVIEYIQKVWDILKPGGYWISFGPLLYHFADVWSQISVELTYEEIKDLITKKFKFNMLKEETGLIANYVQNKNSMMKVNYECIFFVVQKPLMILNNTNSV